MRAVVYRRYGPADVLQIADVEKPVPDKNEVLVRNQATTVCAGDLRLRKADPFFLMLYSGLLRPTKINILGMEFAGRIEAVGIDVTRFRVGDEVFGSTGLRFGAYSEYLCVSADKMVELKPANMTYAEAAPLSYGGASALHFLRAAAIQPRQNVLIYGASGCVGTAAVQLAKHFGAHVVGVCSTANLDLVKSLGADEVLDYTREDFSKAGRVYDIVFDTVGKAKFSHCLRSLRRGGTYASTAAPLSSLVEGPWVSATGAAKVIGGMARVATGDLAFLKGLVEAGELTTVIDRKYALQEIVDAHRYADAGHKRGNVVIDIAQEDETSP